MLPLFSSRNLMIFTVVAVAQGAAGYYVNARREYVPPTRPLHSLAQSLDGWTMVKEWPVEPEAPLA